MTVLTIPVGYQIVFSSHLGGTIHAFRVTHGSYCHINTNAFFDAPFIEINSLSRGGIPRKVQKHLKDIAAYISVTLMEGTVFNIIGYRGHSK